MTPLILTSTPEPAKESSPSAPGNREPSELTEPRQDYLVLTEVLDGFLSYPPRSDQTLLGRIEKKTGADIRQAFAAVRLRRTVSVYVSLSEKIGLPLALLLPRDRKRRPGHVVVVHHLTSTNKRKLQRQTNYLQRFDRIVTLGETQRAYCIDEAGIAPQRVGYVRDAVDARFWTPQESSPTKPTDRPMILSVGRERRDYETLADAVRTMPDLDSVVVASSPWSRQSGAAPTRGEAPANMTFRKGLAYTELRALYASAALIVVPVEAGTAYAAGANGVLEGMSMHKPVIASDTPGLSDYRSGEADAVLAFAPAGDPAALAASIRALLADPERSRLLATNGRRFVEATGNTDSYVAALAQIARDAERDS